MAITWTIQLLIIAVVGTAVSRSWPAPNTDFESAWAADRGESATEAGVTEAGVTEAGATGEPEAEPTEGPSGETETQRGFPPEVPARQTGSENPSQGADNSDSVICQFPQGLETDDLERKHTWGFLFDSAFTALHSEGTQYTDLAKEVFRKASGRLGYVYHQSSTFLDALKQYLARSVGFNRVPSPSEIASVSGKHLYVQALNYLRSHVSRDLLGSLIRKTGEALGKNQSHITRGLVLIGLLSLGLILWVITSCTVKQCKYRKEARLEKKRQFWADNNHGRLDRAGVLQIISELRGSEIREAPVRRGAAPRQGQAIPMQDMSLAQMH